MQDDVDLRNNPYAPTIELTGPDQDVSWSDADRVRHEHHKTETNVRSTAYLYYLLAALAAWCALAFFRAALGLGQAGQDAPVAESTALGSGLAAIAAAFGWCGRGLQTLNPRVRWPAIWLISPIALVPPLGTLFALYVIYTLGCEQSKFILSHEYRRIVQVTPYVRPQSTIYRLLIIGLVVAVAMIVVLLLLFNES